VTIPSLPNTGAGGEATTTVEILALVAAVGAVSAFALKKKAFAKQ